ncbi:ABC transporter ATP-binding protein [Brevibacterium sp.]|uniref:ABC transporter ATP-binding protein n=1 Tax=Brevibacterium sp. TaxID=1701 RepID=UPI002811D7DA|nr:ABC transporter ATP-binding protein [Brevibacterium sp.]
MTQPLPDPASPTTYSAPPIARVRNVTKTYASAHTSVTALQDVDLDVAPAQMTAIMGPSGSGKSTLMHIMAGLDTPTSGRVLIGDREISALDDDELTKLRRRKIGFVFQAFNLISTLTVIDNILLPFELDDRKPTTQEREWVDHLVARLGIDHRRDHRPNEISGGQQQRVAIARALATRPDVLFADEPTGNLDSRSGREVMRIMSEAVRDLGQSIVLVTHDPLVAASAGRVVFLADGRPVTELAGTFRAEEVAQTMLDLESDAALDSESDVETGTAHGSHVVTSATEVEAP